MSHAPWKGAFLWKFTPKNTTTNNGKKKGNSQDDIDKVLVKYWIESKVSNVYINNKMFMKIME